MTSKTLTLLCAVLLAAPLPTAAQDANMAREAMAQVMVRMMEMMGLFGAGTFGSGSGLPIPPGMNPMTAMNPMGSLSGPSGASPWDLSSMQDPSKAMGLGSEMMKQMTGATPGATSSGVFNTAPLDGVWEGSGGDMLIVQRGRYRIYAPQDQYVDGLLQLQASQVALYNSQDGHTQIFDFATQDGRLALRDSSGQVYLYRRFGETTPTSPLTQTTPPLKITPMPPTTPSTASTR